MKYLHKNSLFTYKFLTYKYTYGFPYTDLHTKNWNIFEIYAF